MLRFNLSPIRILVANMVGSSALLKREINGRIWPKRSNQLKDRVPISAAEKANRYILNGIVERSRSQLVSK